MAVSRREDAGMRLQKQSLEEGGLNTDPGGTSEGLLPRHMP